MQRDGDRLELVLADGLLCVEEHHLKHPVLLQRLTLEFDPTGPEFRFFAGVEKIELQRALLRLVPTIEARMIARFDDQLETEPVDLLGGERTEGFLKRLVQGLFKDGEFLDSERAHSRFPGHALTPTGVMAIRCKQFHLPDL